MYQSHVRKGAVRGGMLFLAAGLLWTTPGQAAPPQDAFVIPSGQEELLGRMAGVGPDPVGAGCRLAGAAMEKSLVRLTYACPDGDVPLELRHRGEIAEPLAATEQFAIVSGASEVPEGLLAGLTERIRANEAGWSWLKVKAPTAKEELTFTPEEQRLRSQGMALYAEGRHSEALAKYIRLARTNPHHGTLGMAVATLASTRPDAARVRALTAAAAKYPDDALAQFLAGVGAHYAAHQAAQSFAEKADLYRVALEHLQRVEDAFAFEPRLFIYLAVSHFRLGNQAEAEKYIEKAAELAVDDPDVFYCRAEIYQRKDVHKALEDLEHYIEMSARLQELGAVVTEKKEKQVRNMYRHLKDVSEGRADHQEIFDPIDSATIGAPARSAFSRMTVGAGALAFLAALGFIFVRRRRSR